MSDKGYKVVEFQPGSPQYDRAFRIAERLHNALRSDDGLEIELVLGGTYIFIGKLINDHWYDQRGKESAVEEMAKSLKSMLRQWNRVQ